MRSAFTVLASAGSVLLAGADGASAQQRAFVGRGDAATLSAGIGTGGYSGRSSYDRPDLGVRVYGPNAYNYRYSYGYMPNRYGHDWSYYTPAPVYGTPPSYYFTAPSYFVVPATYDPQGPEAWIPTQQPIQATYRPVGAAQQYAVVRVMAPTADTLVWFGSTPTTQQGRERLFHSPALEAVRAYTYTITDRWTIGGKSIEQTRQVAVRAGQNSTADFRDAARELAPAPDPARPR